MIRPFTCVTMLIAAGAGLYLYQAKHRGQMLDREIAQTIHATEETRARIGVLRAEFALLGDPTRLQELAAAHLPRLAPTQPGQFTVLAELDARLPAIGVRAAPAPQLEPAALPAPPPPLMAGAIPTAPGAPTSTIAHAPSAAGRANLAAIVATPPAVPAIAAIPVAAGPLATASVAPEQLLAPAANSSSAPAGPSVGSKAAAPRRPKRTALAAAAPATGLPSAPRRAPIMTDPLITPASSPVFAPTLVPVASRPPPPVGSALGMARTLAGVTSGGAYRPAVATGVSRP